VLRFAGFLPLTIYVSVTDLPHEELVKSVGLDPTRTDLVGGELTVDEYGAVAMDRSSGHFNSGWTAEIQAEVERTMTEAGQKGVRVTKDFC
jgi:hypothetical protein